MAFEKGILPPGYRFLPSDKILIQDYLVPKARKTLNDVSWFIFEKEIYNYSNPFLLFQEIQRNQAYFFTPIRKVSSSGKNVKRCTGEGKWRGEKPTPLSDDDNKVIGTKRMFVFEWNVPKEKVREVEREKGHWIMHEYSLLPDYYINNNIKTDPEYVLCEIRCKIPIINVDAVREDQRQSQPVAKRQRTSMSSPSMDTVHAVEPPINNGSSTSWVPSPLPVLNNVESSSDWVPSSSSPPQATKTMDPYVPLPECEFPSDLFLNGESSATSTPLFSNAELSEWVPSQPPATNPYVPVPVPAPTTMLSEFQPLTGDEWVDFFTFDDNELVTAVEDNLINTTTTPNNNFSQSVEELDAAIKEDWVQDAVLPTNHQLLLQDEDEDDFAKLLEGILEARLVATTKDSVAVSLEADLKGSNNNYVQQEENNYSEILMNDSRKVLKVSDAEAMLISKLGWDPVAYKANVEAMLTTYY
ncbi:NAC domain-containing protein 82-like [Papaver somniferum]|uniref:NAC domain-containing protein 82-like n=1 Tax=Papaver somniferum TaxID=3469 RepID=UPI000E705C83|nr:NAC domain-containing protein 82-like [Papaver somniferum]